MIRYYDWQLPFCLEAAMEVILFLFAIIALVINIIIFVIFIQAMISVKKIRVLLEEVIDSGAIPQVIEYRMKQFTKKAREMLKHPNSYSRFDVNDIIQQLSNIKDNEEASQLTADLKKALEHWGEPSH
jgi:regulatory protein YycI of two-component signal transduction system YycFG